MYTDFIQPTLGYLNSLRNSKSSGPSSLGAPSPESDLGQSDSDQSFLRDRGTGPKSHRASPTSTPGDLFDPYRLDCDQAPFGSGAADCDTIGDISDGGSVIRYSLNSSMAHSHMHENSQRMETLTAAPTNENNELTLKLLNAYLSLYVADARYAQDNGYAEYSVKLNQVSSPQEIISTVPDSIGPLTDIIGFADLTSQALSKFVFNTDFQKKCSTHCWDHFELAELKNHISAILECLVLEYAPQEQQPLFEKFEKSLALLKRMKADTRCWKQTRSLQKLQSDDWVLEKLNALKFVPRTLLEALNFDVIMPQDATPFSKSRRGDIETLEVFTTLYAILLLEIRKLFELVILVAQTAGIMKDLECSLLLGCLEGFLRNSVVSGNTELVVGLDKLVQKWTHSCELFKAKTIHWANRFLTHWKVTRPESVNDTTFYSRGSLEQASQNLKSYEFDLVHLFINEVMDICALDSLNAEVLEATTVKEKAPASGLGWLTIFQDDDPHANPSTIQTRTIETSASNDFFRFQNNFSLIEDETTIIIGGQGHFWTRGRRNHEHHHTQQLRDWIRRGFHSNDIGTKHHILNRCQRAKNKLKSLAQKLSKSEGSKSQFRNRRSAPGKETTPVLKSEWHRHTDTVRVTAKAAANGKNPKSVAEDCNHNSYYHMAAFHEAFEATTYSDHYEHRPRRYENLRKKKDRFMFLFFGEEK
ncbi:LAQU0S06e04258g1_1 [Lachancea quebecensis]|uniref:LAQU0S06e04258g1_1 n=1 Tax=Lachancea quebecensis TaxID=1654605 RepID=A0A0P1KS18_9SACH|nr:LAQU0S06e04258g1_1 [Lachancea quebecensis]